ncbi:DNA helicase [Trifolium repens]|nr:DNA helicase [Trifolium repens]
MYSTYSRQYTKSLFDEVDATVVAYRVYNILKDFIDWNNAHHGENYLDMVKVKYRTFQIEYPNTEGYGKLPSMFTEEFDSELYKYNKLVDHYCNEFEVIAEKRVDGIYFSHGWLNIRTCYIDFVDENHGWAGSVVMPYCHDSGNFAHSFVVILSESDVSSQSLTVNYGKFACKVFYTVGGSVKLIDEKGKFWVILSEMWSRIWQTCYLSVGCLHANWMDLTVHSMKTVAYSDYSLDCALTTVIKDLSSKLSLLLVVCMIVGWTVDGCDGADYTQFACDLDGDATFEGGGSSNHEEPILSDTTRTPASKTTSKEGSNVDGARSSTTKGSSPSTVELVGVDVNQVSPLKQATTATPTSKKSGKKADKVGAAGSSPAKARSPCTRSMTSAEIGHVSPPKQAGKRSANIDQGEIVAAKDTKMPCVKVEVIE